MKTFLNLKLVTLMLLSIVVLSLTACDKDEPAVPSLKDEVVGTWDITSYKLGGDEYMGLIFDAASLSFGAYTDAEGEFTQEVTFPDEEASSITGAYTFDEDENKVIMEYDQDIITAKITITDGYKLKWDGSQDGFPLVIEAIKRN
jgi:hypothetical protein